MARPVLADLLASRATPVADARFAAAYAALAPGELGLFKTGIKHIFEVWHGHRQGTSVTGAAYAGGFALTRRVTPRDYALILTPGRTAAPMRVLAAALPAQLSGVSEVAVAGVGGALSLPTLAALELAGIESAVRLGKSSLAGLCAELCASGLTGAVLALDPDLIAPAVLAGLAACPDVALYVAPPVRLAALAGPKSAPDLDAIALAHGVTPVTVYGGPDADLPEPFVAAPGGLPELLAAAPLAAFAPEAALPKMLGKIPLALGPGREAVFLWPDLDETLFAVSSLAVSRRLP